jgi:photosystem II stability/assembly factor-like uncharacterized protein
VDGAKHWETQLKGESTAGPSTIQFFDTKRGFVAVGNPLEIHRTVDGGQTWKPIPVPDVQSSFATFSDPRHGWLLAGAYPNQTKPTRLYATSDAGDTWQRLPDPPAESLRMTFRSPQEGWLRTAGQNNFIYISRDAGQSWARLDIPDPPGRAKDQTVIVADLRLMPGMGAVASVAFSDGRAFQLPFHEFTSFDMGRTWTYVPQLQSQDPRSMSWDTFEDATHWWASLGANLYKSSDAGQTWKLVSAKLENGDNWRYTIQVLDSKHAWAQLWMGQMTGLAMTTDGGLHWTRANVPEPAS